MSCLNRLPPIKTTTPTIETPATQNTLNEKQVLLKFVLVGDAKTGKTCIVNQFAQNRFNDDYRPTISSSFDTQQIIIDDDKTDKKYIIQLELWDTSGTLHSIPILNNESSLKSKKHPNSSTNNHNKHKNTNNKNYKQHFNKYSQYKQHENNIRQTSSSDNELDLQSFFDEVDAKEAMESLSDKPTTYKIKKIIYNNTNDKLLENDCIKHIDYKQIIINNNNNNMDRNGYYSSSSTNNGSSTESVESEMFQHLDALILVYDITNSQSLSNLNGWIELFAQYVIDSEDVPILVLGNKKDLETQRCIHQKQGRIFTQNLINPYKLFHEVSAKMDHESNELKDIFIELARKCIDKEASILELMSSDSIASIDCSINANKTTYKRYSRSNDFSVKTCAHSICNKNGETQDPFCIVL